jgi:hypothetical protein
LKMLFPDAGIFLWGFSYQLGKVQRDLAELKQCGLLCNDVESIAKLGYQRNFGIKPDESLLSLVSGPFAGLLDRCRTPQALVVHHSYAESTSLQADPTQAGFMPRVQYFPAALMREFHLDHIPYLGSFASGCAGLLSLLMTACCFQGSSRTEPVICLTADVKPTGSTYDAQREKILTSDCSSGFLLGREKCGYQLLGLSYYSTTRMIVPLVEIVKRSVQMTQGLAKDLGIDLAGGDVVLHYPNIFPTAWDMVTRYLQVPPERQVLDGLAERAHCLSSDAVISLSKQHGGGAGRVHVVVNFGSGLHLGVGIFREEARLESTR